MSDRLNLTWGRKHSAVTDEHRAASIEMRPGETLLRAFLREQFARHTEQQGGKAEGAAGNDSGVHAPNVLRANGARKSAP